MHQAGAAGASAYAHHAALDRRRKSFGALAVAGAVAVVLLGVVAWFALREPEKPRFQRIVPPPSARAPR